MPGAQTAALILETEGQSLIAARGSAEQVECFLPLSPACGKGPIPLPLDHLLGETNPGTPGFGQRLPRGTVCRG